MVDRESRNWYCMINFHEKCRHWLNYTLTKEQQRIIKSLLILLIHIKCCKRNLEHYGCESVNVVELKRG